MPGGCQGDAGGCQGDARGMPGGMNDMAFDLALLQPARQPEPVPTGFRGNAKTRDRPTGLDRCVAPAVQPPQQPCRIGRQLLLRRAVQPPNQPANQPARLAHLDHRNQRAILIEGDKAPALIVELSHGTLHQRWFSDQDATPRRPPHSVHDSARPRRVIARSEATKQSRAECAPPPEIASLRSQ